MNRQLKRSHLSRTIANRPPGKAPIPTVIEPLEPRHLFSGTPCAPAPAQINDRLDMSHAPVVLVSMEVMALPPRGAPAILRAGPGGFIGILNRSGAQPGAANDLDSQGTNPGNGGNSTQTTTGSAARPDDGEVVLLTHGGRILPPVISIGIRQDPDAAPATAAEGTAAPVPERAIVKDRAGAEIVFTRSSEIAATGPATSVTPLSQAPAPIAMNFSNASQGLRGRQSYPLGDISVLPTRSNALGSFAGSGNQQGRVTLAGAWPAGAVFFANGSIGEHAGIGVATATEHVTSKTIDALAAIGSPQVLAGEVMYNFVHFSPSALLDDAIAGFANESAALSLTSPFSLAPASSRRAWTITAAVIGLDLIIMSCLYRRAKADRTIKAKLAGSWGVEIDPCQPRLL